jgi:hypothetical protein
LSSLSTWMSHYKQRILPCMDAAPESSLTTSQNKRG